VSYAVRDYYIEIGGDPIPLSEIKYIYLRRIPDFQSSADNVVKKAEAIFGDSGICRWFYDGYSNWVALVVGG